MSDRFNAIVIEKADKGSTAAVSELGLDDLPAAGVLVDVEYSTVNYKDGLAVTGAGKICRQFPMVGGIDLAGVVAESDDPRWSEGDRVLVNGYGLSEDFWGGYSQKQRVNPDFLVKVPDNLSSQQAMAIGTAGYTSMLAVNAIRDGEITPESGPIIVTGAAGGVGSVAVMLLAKLGYEVTATTGRPETGDYLKSLGAANIMDRADFARDAKPLEKEIWAGSVDSVGSTTLATVLTQTKNRGVVAACGLAGGFDLPVSVMPFLLRGVRLQGIDSVLAPMSERTRAWQDLSGLLDLKMFEEVYSVEPLARVPELAAQILKGQIRGRIVIDVNA
ncbi:MAG: MDR family oxidoreductase [Pseudomonadota bacterium]